MSLVFGWRPRTRSANEMGIRLGTLAHVTQHAAFGGRVIAVAGSRYALDGQTAALIDVEPVERFG